MAKTGTTSLMGRKSFSWVGDKQARKMRTDKALG